MISDHDAQQLLQTLGSDPAQLKHLFDLFPLGVIITNLDGLIIYYNKAHGKIDDLNPDDVLGRLEIEVLSPITGPNIMQVCQKTAQPILGYIFPYRTYKGREVNAAYWVFPIFTAGLVSGAICFTQPLQVELSQSRTHSGPPIQWPGAVPINMPRSNLVGSNPGFQKAVQQIKNNSANPFPILIAGETGSGKEMLAKLTHQASPRRQKPYLALNCSAIPGTLLEGLLFGTVKGSFTGAIDRAGLLEEANGGTLYLDEIDSMPMELQPKLLRVIQEMRVTRVGSSQETKLNFKLVSSIASSPRKALNDGRLRSDLFYRLAVVVINIPPLRERLDDLEALAEHFICKYNNMLGKSALKIDPRLLEIMCSYSWPGNVREMEHMLAGALTMVRDENVIGLEHIPDHYMQAFFNNSSTAKPQDFIPISKTTYTPDHSGDQINFNHLDVDNDPNNEPGLHPKNSLLHRLNEEAMELRECLSRTNGNVTQAANLLGISRQLFKYRMMKFGLDRTNFKRHPPKEKVQTDPD